MTSELKRRKLLGTSIAGLGLTALITALPADAAENQEHPGWICRPTNGDYQEHVDYHSPNGYIENESSTVGFVVGCGFPTIDNHDTLNRFRVRVENGTSDVDAVECDMYRSKTASDGTVSYVDVDSNDSDSTGADTIDFNLYDSSQTQHSRYMYYGKCYLPAVDNDESKIFMWEGHSAGTVCPGIWSSCER